MRTILIENKHRPLPTPLQAVHCSSFLCRLRGLMFRTSLGLNEGLLLVEKKDSRIDASIHMLFMRMDLAVIWFNSRHIVVDAILARAWRPVYAPCQPARYTLEIHPLRMNEFKIGDTIEFLDA